MPKIYITTFQNADNYGAMFQCYALSSFLSKKFSTAVVNYDNKTISKEYRLFRKPLRNPVKGAVRLLDDFLSIGDSKTRRKNFESFRNRIPLTQKVQSLNELALNDDDILITGSDQVWNPCITRALDTVYFLESNNKKCKKISYAASCGSVSTLANLSSEFKQKLKSFNAISAREESLAEFIKTITGNKPFISADPTIFLSKDEWVNLSGKKRIIKEKYIFTYTVAKPDEKFYESIKAISKKTGYKIVSFNKKGLFAKYENGGYNWYKAGPEDYLNLLCHSEFVITASFHGLAMSAIMNKNMIIVPRTDPDRLFTFAKAVGLEGRILDNAEDSMKVFDDKIDWGIVNKSIKKLRDESSKWLLAAINGEKK